MIFYKKETEKNELVARPEVWCQSHCGHLVDVLLDLVEEVVPASDELALVLVVDHVELVGLPCLLDLLQELLKGHLSLGHQDDVTDEGLVLEEVDVPNLAQAKV